MYAFKQLPYYGRALQRLRRLCKDKPCNDEERHGKIANPTVHIGLNQIRTVVNALIRRYGRPTEIVVELARDLKQSREQKQETQRRQADNQRRNDRIRKEIAAMRGILEHNVKVADIQKWILWEELTLTWLTGAALTAACRSTLPCCFQIKWRSSTFTAVLANVGRQPEQPHGIHARSQPHQRQLHAVGCAGRF